MRETSKRQYGMATIEVALIMPLLAALLYVLVEGGNTIRVYSALSEASRAAARQVVMTGDEAGVQDIVRSLVTIIPAQNVTARLIRDNAKGMVTVEVSYGYRSLFTANPASGDPHDALYTLTARTSMPLP